jgi:NitT/TauT family transport system substrate-binding protein
MTPLASTLSRRRLLAAGAAIIGAPAFAQAAPVKIRYQLDWRFGASAVPYIVALKKGYFLQEGVDVTLNVGSGSAGTVTRIASGNFEMGTGDVNALAEFAANNKDIPAKAVMLIYEHTASAVFALKKSGIRSPADLKSRQLASPVSDTGRRLFPLFASANGLDAEKDVTWMSVEPALRETMLVRGRTDAITANVSSGLVALTKLGTPRDDIVMMRYSDFGVPLYGNAILANPNFIRDNPRAVTAFLRGYLRGLKDAHLDRRGGLAALKQFEPLIDEQFEAEGLDIIIDHELASPQAKKNGVGEIDLVKFQKGIDMLSKVIAFNSKPDPASLIDMRLLPTRAERMVF